MKKTLSRPNGYLALFATFLVVGGVVFAAVLATPAINPDAKPPTLPQTPVATADATSTGGVLVIGDGKAILHRYEGSSGMTWPDDVKLLGKPLSQFEGADAKTGERVYLAAGFLRATSTGIHSPDGRRALFPSPAKADGTGNVEVHLGNERQTVVVRLGNGKGVKDVMPVGWWDSDSLAVTGRVTSTRMLFAVTLAGEVSPIVSIPDAANGLLAQGGNVWYVTLEPGEGLESPPGPPSELHRVSRDGDDIRLSVETKNVITAYVPFGDTVAYQKDSGEFFVISPLSSLDTGNIPLGDGTPLLFIDPTHVVIRKSGKLLRKEVFTGLEETILDTIPENASVYVVPPSTAQ